MKRKMETYSFTVIIERQPEGEYLVTVPALPGCYTEGQTLEEARYMASDAISAYCTSLRNRGPWAYVAYRQECRAEP
jgi:antitoxin HicB